MVAFGILVKFAKRFFKIPDNQTQLLMYMRAGEYDKAIELLSQLLEKDPNDNNSMINLSAAYYHKGDIQQAINVLLKANSMFPNDPTILSNLGLYYNETKHFDKAISVLQDGLGRLSDIKNKELDMNVVEFHLNYNLGVALFETGSLREALKVVEKVLSLDSVDNSDIELILELRNKIKDSLSKL